MHPGYNISFDHRIINIGADIWNLFNMNKIEYKDVASNT